jgi:hypothetical protein
VSYFFVSVLFLVLGSLLLFFAAWAAYGVHRVLRENRKNQAYLTQSADETPLRVDHLAPRLRSFALDTRLMRIGLDAPTRQIQRYLEGDEALSAEDIEVFDATLLDLSRQLTEWVKAFESLPEADRERLRSRGVDAAPVRLELEREGGAFERRNLRRAGVAPLPQRLRGLIQSFVVVERVLEQVDGPYR